MTAPNEIVLIPAFNEAPRLPAILRALKGSHAPDEIVVIDDGSSDGTGAVAERHGVTLLRHSFNQCVLQGGPPQFPDTGCFSKRRIVEMDAANFDPATWFAGYQS